MVTCRVCEATFKYSNNLSLDFTSEKIMGREFSNLKGALKKHLESSKHLKMAEELEKKELIKSKEDLRNTAVGVRIGRLVYHVVKLGRPDTDFPSIVPFML